MGDLDDALPDPPQDEDWKTWHYAASSQLITAASGLTSDFSAALWRAKDFADRAMKHGTTRENIVTQKLMEAIADVRADIEKEMRG